MQRCRESGGGVGAKEGVQQEGSNGVQRGVLRGAVRGSPGGDLGEGSQDPWEGLKQGGSCGGVRLEGLTKGVCAPGLRWGLTCREQVNFGFK